MNERILVAMSGGVDSSVAAHLIKSSGAPCVGVTLKMFSLEDIALDGNKSCCSVNDAEDARIVAKKLSMEHHIFNFGEGFRENVMERFVKTYELGGTPNPCIDCNRYIKWAGLLKKADEMGCSHMATGHYARIEKDGSGRSILMRAADKSKDQSYVLWTLTGEQLARTVFPLGSLTKDEVREIALSCGFSNADKPDSQDICFVPDGDYAGFIERFRGKTYPEGDFVDADGKPVGKHKGIIRYTIGQRKGLGISYGRRIFVTAIDPVNNTVTLDDEPALFSKRLTASGINLTAVDRIDAPLRVMAKVRYNARAAAATVYQTDTDEIEVIFDEPQRAITKGQSVVLYSDDTVIGGGIIR